MVPAPAGVVSQDGSCCAQGAHLDAAGACCSQALDACGACGGNATAVDFTGSCCVGVLDAGGLCCSAAVDEVGVCGGSGTSGALALTTDAVTSAGLQGQLSMYKLCVPRLGTCSIEPTNGPSSSECV